MSKQAFSFLNNPRSLLAEAYRSLRTNLLSALRVNPCRTILVSSALAGEGKTTTVMNLGAALAGINKKVVLIDSDLRRPMLQQMMGVESESGLTELAADLLAQSVTKGFLKQRKWGDVFYLLRIQGATGRLTLKNQWGELEVIFLTGAIVGLHCRMKETAPAGATASEARRTAPPGAKGELPEWRRFLLRSDKDTEYIFTESSALALHAAERQSICWESIFEHMSGFQSIPYIFSRISFHLQPAGLENLWLLASGSPPEHPAEFLNSPVMREILHILGKCFDFVILDSPPVNAVTDASQLVSYCDGLILVLRSHKVDRRLAMDTLEQLQCVHANLLGVVLNNMDLKKHRYRYYKGYQHLYRYGYSYGYGGKK